MNNKNIRRILLIQPPAYTNLEKMDLNPNMPLGLAYIAGVLEKENYEVKILDAFVEGWDNEVPINDDRLLVGMSYSEIESIISEYKPDVVGISSMFTLQREHAHRVAKISKEIDSKIIVVMGGPHPTVAPETVIVDKNVDYCIIGEGEESFLLLLRRIQNGEGVADIDGIAFREGEKVVIKPRTKFIEDLDGIPFPARHLLPVEKYYKIPVTHGGKLKFNRYATIVTSRGCPAKCSFCSAHRVWGRGYRMRSSENVLAEMRHLKEKYGIKELLFEDDNLTLNRKRAIEIFDGMIKEKFNFVWNTPNGIAAFALNEEVIRKMKESGCCKMNLAIESGNQYVMDNIIKKPLKLEKVKKIIKYARKIHLETGVFFVIGMPGETLDQMRESFRFSEKLGIYSPFISIATPYPGTELLDICRNKNYLFKEYSLDNLNIFKHSFETPDWKTKDVDRLKEEEMLRLRSRYMVKHPMKLLLKILGSLIKPKRLLNGGRKYISYLIRKKGN